MEEIVILHTNDLHSHLERWPKIRRMLDNLYTEETSQGKQVYKVDLGDFCDRVHPLTEATDGKANVSLMNRASYDVVTIGNNEGIGNTHEQLNHLYDEAEFPIVVGNLQDKNNKVPDWASMGEIFETEQGTKVGFIGLTAPFPFSYGPLEWEVLAPGDVLPDLIAVYRNQVDVLVLLSHLGILDDEHIAEHYPEIDVIIGSHTHHLLETGKVMNHTLLTAAGRYGEYIGKIHLTLEQHKLKDFSSITIKIDDIPNKTEEKKEVQGYLEKGTSLLASDILGYLPFTWSNQSSKKGSFVVEALKAMEQFVFADGYMLSTGLFLGSLERGIVSKKELHEKVPHPMHLVRVLITGEHLGIALDEIFNKQDYLQELPVTGMGFRGRIFGEIVFRHIERESPANYFIRGEKLIREKDYELVMVDHYIFAPFFPLLKKYGKIISLSPSLLRNVIGEYIMENYPLAPKKVIIDEGR